MPYLIGIDCAVQAKDTGLALAEAQAESLVVLEARAGTRLESPAVIAAEWLESYPKAVIAIDAPLGWPAELAATLANHRAGESIPVESHQLFRRQTDLFVRSLIGKQTLDVGADRIARTAHAAVNLLGELRNCTGLKLPLLWGPKEAGEGGVIEVYPAGTLKTLGLRSSGYKGQNRTARNEVLRALNEFMDLSRVEDVLLEDDDCLDAAICCLAAWDFVRGLAAPPESKKKARREGWIWVRSPDLDVSAETSHE